MSIGHTHSDPGVLTFACPACVDVVRQDQENARWSDAPVRECTIIAHIGELDPIRFTIDLRVPAVTDPTVVAARHRRPILRELSRILVANRWTPDQVAALASGGARLRLDVTVGPIVVDVTAAVPNEWDVPLFEVGAQ